MMTSPFAIAAGRPVRGPDVTLRNRRPDHRQRTIGYNIMQAVAAVGLLIVAAIPVSAFDTEAVRFYEDAVGRLERQDVVGAIIQLNNALQKQPGMLAAHVLLGKARLRNNDPAGAETAFERALRLGVDRAEVALPLAQAFVAQGKYEVMFERISPTGLPKPIQVEILILRGNAQAELGDLTGAMRSFDDARAIDTLSVPVQLARANLMLRTGQLARASTLADEIVKLSPDDSPAWNLKASVSHLKGDLRDALAGYTKAIALNPNNLDARAAQAGLLLDLDRLDEADKAVTDLQSVSPREPRGAYLRAVIASRRNDFDTVRKSLGDAVALIEGAPKSLVSRYGQLLLVAGLSHHGLGNMEKAAEYLAAYVKQYPKQPGPSKLLASIYLDRGDVARAIALLSPLQTSAQNDPQLLSLLAAAYMADRRYTLANDLLERAVKVSGGTPELRADFGVSLIATGQPELGFSQLQQAFAKDTGQARAGVVLATRHLKRGQPKKALEFIEPVVRRDPKNVDATNLLGVVRVAAGDKAGGRAAYEKALALNPRYQPARMNLVRLDIAEGKHDTARLQLTELLKANRNDGDAMFEYALLEESMGRPTEAVAWLERARAIRKLQVRAGVYLTELLMRQHKFEYAVNVANDVVSRAPRDFSALRSLSQAQIAAGDRRGARQTLSTMVPSAGFDPDMNVEIARLQVAVGDREGALHSVDKVLKGSADYLPALELLTELEIRSGNYAKAEQHARGIGERYPARGLGLRLMGDLAVARGQFGPAITNYRAALAKEKSVDTVLRLNRAHALAGDAATGLTVLERWLRDNPNDLLALRVLADGRLMRGNLAAARANYEQLLQRHPNDVEVLNNLAQVALRQGDKAALQFAERAYSLANGEPSIVDTLGWVLVQQGQLDRGLSLLRDARLRDATNPEIRFHYASALAMTGREAEARSELKEVLKGGATFGEIEEARKLQRQLGP
jgi:putative PEP-CTERM system TPR-repeat lipoprotein